MKKLIIGLAALAATLSGITQAVPWCHRGTILQIADVNWNQSQILANFSGTIPAGVLDPEVYTTFNATANYASTFAGGGGGFGGYSVPGSGQVKVLPYAPNSYTNMVGPGNYFTSQGIQFRLKKCYTIPPMTIVEDYEMISRPDGPIIVKPFEHLEAISSYWDTKVTDPDEDEDFDGEELDR